MLLLHAAPPVRWRRGGEAGTYPPAVAAWLPLSGPPAVGRYR